MEYDERYWPDPDVPRYTLAEAYAMAAKVCRSAYGLDDDPKWRAAAAYLMGLFQNYPDAVNPGEPLTESELRERAAQKINRPHVLRFEPNRIVLELTDNGLGCAAGWEILENTHLADAWLNGFAKWLQPELGL